MQSHTYSTVGTTPLSVAAPGVLSSDVGTALSATLKTAPGHGSVGIDANGSFTYTADAGFSGVDTFQYTATDSSGLSGTATVTVQVTPAAASPDYTTAADTTLTVPAGQGVAAVSDGSGLTASETSGPTHGSLSLSGDGSFSYVPDSGYSGNDSFGFEVTELQQPAGGRHGVDRRHPGGQPRQCEHRLSDRAQRRRPGGSRQ